MSTTEEVTITGDGQVTIPENVRERLELEEGDSVSFTVAEDGIATLRKTTDPMAQLRDVRERLAPLDVSVERLQHEADQQWSKFE